MRAVQARSEVLGERRPDGDELAAVALAPGLERDARAELLHAVVLEHEAHGLVGDVAHPRRELLRHAVDERGDGRGLLLDDLRLREVEVARDDRRDARREHLGRRDAQDQLAEEAQVPLGLVARAQPDEALEARADDARARVADRDERVDVDEVPGEERLLEERAQLRVAQAGEHRRASAGQVLVDVREVEQVARALAHVGFPLVLAKDTGVSEAGKDEFEGFEVHGACS